MLFLQKISCWHLMMENKELPRLLYISDVPVELSYAGATLVYRLLEQYPKEKLMIVQGLSVNKLQRLKGVSYYETHRGPLDRLRKTRFSKLVKWMLVVSQYSKLGKFSKEVKKFQPEAILTVTSGLMWLKALHYSEKNQLPLHVILHDDLLSTDNYGIWHRYLSKRFSFLYKFASGRYCISPAMEKYYFSLYGVHGDIIYPNRGMNDKMYKPEEKQSAGSLKYCYAGTLYTGDFLSMLDDLAATLRNKNAELHIYSDMTDPGVSFKNLSAPHVKFHALMKPSELMELMHKEMDVAVLLNSFLHERIFRYNFSSKLVDYSSAGMPVLLWGPQSSGCIQWAISSGYEGVLTTREKRSLEAMVNKLSDAGYRYSLAAKMNALALDIFSYEKNYTVLEKGLTGTKQLMV